MIKFLLLTIIALNGTLCSAEVPQSCLETVKSFFTSWQSGETEKAVKELMAVKSKWGGREEIIKMVTTLQSMSTEVLGKYYGHEIIHHKIISANYFIIVVMAKFEREPMFFKFGFYRPSNVFIIDTFNMNTTVSEVQKEWLAGSNELFSQVDVP